MATIIECGGGGGAKVTMLASLTDVPTSSTAINGTENWKKYDAIYFECFMYYSDPADKSVFTHLILTNNVSIGARYQIARISGADGGMKEVNVFCFFSENALSIHKKTSTYGVTMVNIYGVKF